MKTKYMLKEYHMARKGYWWIALAFLLSLTACKKFVQINPPTTEIAAATVFSNNVSAAAAMSGIYVNMMSNSNYLSDGSNSISLLQGLASDELTDYDFSDAPFPQFYSNSLTSSTGRVSNNYYWTEIYNEIYAANTVIEGVENSVSITPVVKQQLIGEAEFMRAFLHFYAVNLYGPVPIVLTTNYSENNKLKRSAVSDVYQQVIQDLKDAQAKLSVDFVDGAGISTGQRTRPNRGAATALLARVYLYTGKWDSAEAQATNLISNSQYNLMSDLDSVFLENSMEAIWQLQPVVPGVNTFDADMFVLTSPPSSSQFPVALSTYLLNAFEPNDKRDSDWVGAFTADSVNYYYYPFKYKVVDNYDPSVPVTEYLMVFRLGEQYLIRAEARAQQANIAGAQADLDMIRTRAGLPNTSASDQASLLNAILHERQVELFTEWGHRWFDLIRTGNITTVMSVVTPNKGGSWNPDKALLPLPLSETQVNPNLSQNSGY